jgi:hypothetical protein
MFIRVALEGLERKRHVYTFTRGIRFGVKISVRNLDSSFLGRLRYGEAFRAFLGRVDSPAKAFRLVGPGEAFQSLTWQPVPNRFAGK